MDTTEHRRNKGTSHSLKMSKLIGDGGETLAGKYIKNVIKSMETHFG